MLARVALFCVAFFFVLDYVQKHERWMFFANLVLAAILTDIFMKFLRDALPTIYVSDLHKKAVFVTGCDSGFGHETAKYLDSAGVTVYAGCLDPDGPGAKHLQEVCSSRLHVVRLDVTKQEDIDKAVLQVKSTLGNKKLWCVLNNAGSCVVGEAEWCPIDTYKKMLDINTLGVISLTKAFLPLIRDARGRVAIVASILGRIGTSQLTAYTTSKHAVVGFAECLRKEMRKWGVTVHTIEPVLYNTRLADTESLRKTLRHSWESCSEEVRIDYGEDYYEHVSQTVIPCFLKTAKPRWLIPEVVGDMVHASIGRFPKFRYVPSYFSQIFTKICTNLPVEVLDLADSIFMRSWSYKGKLLKE